MNVNVSHFYDSGQVSRRYSEILDLRFTLFSLTCLEYPQGKKPKGNILKGNLKAVKTIRSKLVLTVHLPHTNVTKRIQTMYIHESL